MNTYKISVNPFSHALEFYRNGGGSNGMIAVRQKVRQIPNALIVC